MKKILIVDDSKTIRDILFQRIAQAVPNEILAASTFAEASSLIDQHRNNIFAAVLDLNLPDASDGEIVDFAKKNDVPVIVLTATYNKSVREKIISKDVVDYIVKKGQHSLTQTVEILRRMKKNRAVKILVVDDSRTSRFMIKRLLETYQYLVLEAVDGVNALEIMAEHSDIKLIITDYHMPRMDGVELISAVRKNKSKEELAIIGLSSAEDNSLSATLLKCGANDFLTKPFSNEEFHSRISQNVEFLEYVQEIKESYTKLADLNAQITEDLEQARVTQLALLPQSFPDFPSIRIAAKYFPMQETGGDFYDVIHLGNDKVGLVVADVTGHGVSAALISAMISGLVKTFSSSDTSPSTTMGAVNQTLYEKIPEDKFATAFYGIFDQKSKILRFSSAGHPDGYIIRQGCAEVISLKTEGLMLGAFSNDIAHFSDGSIRLETGDKLFLYTDGITEIANTQGEMFGNERLIKLLLQHCSQSLSELLQMVYVHVLKFSGREQFDDDITMLGAEILE